MISTAPPPFVLRSTVVTAALVSSWALRAAPAPDPDANRTLSPHFQVTSPVPDRFDALPLRDPHVEATIAGVIAEVSVIQTYANEGTAPLEAVYVFPGSTRAAVHGLTMVVGDRVVRAKIQRRAEARQTYEAARREGKTASLLEQERPNVFRMNLANIMPGEEVRVELRYTELLSPEEGEYEFVFPTVVGPRYPGRPAPAAEEGQDEWVAMPALPLDEPGAPTFGLDLRVAAPVPIAGLRSPTHPVRVDMVSRRDAHVTLATDADPAGHPDRDFILRYRLTGDAMETGLLLSRAPGGDEGYFLAMIQPPARAETGAIPPREYLFLVDVSGSMHGFPLATAQCLLADLIGTLRPDDSFNLVLFAGGSAVLAERSLPATPENLATAIVLLERQQAGGGTRLLPALETALALPRHSGAARTVVVVTDGYVDIEAEAVELVRGNLGMANLFAFGIGSSVNRHLIESLARAGQGEPFVVTSEREAAAVALRFRRYIEHPVLTGVRATFDGFQATDAVPDPLPDVFARRPVLLYGKWRGGAAGRIRLEGISGGGPFSVDVPVADAVSLDGSRSLELLWARAKITALTDLEGMRPGAGCARAITELGLTHGLLTRHTSFVAVDEIVRNTAAPAKPVRQPVMLPEGVGAQSFGSTVPTTPEPGILGLALVSLLALGWAVRWRKRAESRA